MEISIDKKEKEILNNRSDILKNNIRLTKLLRLTSDSLWEENITSLSLNYLYFFKTTKH